MLTIAAVLISRVLAAEAEPVPEDFPQFIVPGHEAEMVSLRDLFWRHYPTCGPKATLWDEWLPAPTLWPAVTTRNASQYFREQWATALEGRVMDPEGYVATHQHASIAHQLGWPFPFWKQGQGGWGWHVALPGLSRGWHGTEPKTQEGWVVAGAQDVGIAHDTWNLELVAARASIAPPPVEIDTFQAPFLQLRWRAAGLKGAQPYVEWTTDSAPEFSAERRMYFDPIESEAVQYTMIPVHRHPGWNGRVTGLRLQFNNLAPGGAIGIQGFFTQYDTRHTINNANFVRGCCAYFNWTSDLGFLRRQINRMRAAVRYVMTEFHTLESGVLTVDWVGHDGRSGIEHRDGRKILHSGRGIGNNYWDLLPMGHKDAYGTIQFYDALLDLAEVEEAIDAHPEWAIPRGPMRLGAGELREHAGRIKTKFNEVFWSNETGRFVCSEDIDGKRYDYGFTFLNLEAIHYGIATEERARAVMEWIAGERVVEGDTAQGADIYHWRFGPRATTRRNIEYYLWAWSSPESIPWGGQVQDGGAVLGFSYHDLMARIQVRGPDDAAARLAEVVAWYDEVQAAGGYRPYYDGSREGTLQGGGTAGGLGMDQEFFESVLVPQVMIDGFLGLKAIPGGCRIRPSLAGSWTELTITNVSLQDAVYDVRATHDVIELRLKELRGAPGEIMIIEAPGWGMEGRGGVMRVKKEPGAVFCLRLLK